MYLYLECIDFLKKQKPVGPLTYEKGLEEAARDHAEDLGITKFDSRI